MENIPRRWEDLPNNSNNNSNSNITNHAPCGLCRSDPEDNAPRVTVTTACGHSFCFACLQQYTSNEPNRQSKTTTTTSPHNSCPTCHRAILLFEEDETQSESPPSAPTPPSLVPVQLCLQRARGFLHRAASILPEDNTDDDNETGRRPWEEAAVREWQTIVTAHEHNLILLGETDKAPHNNWESKVLHVPLDLYWEAVLQMAALELQWEPEKVLNDLERRLEAERSAYVTELMLWLGDSTQPTRDAAATADAAATPKNDKGKNQDHQHGNDKKDKENILNKQAEKVDLLDDKAELLR